MARSGDRGITTFAPSDARQCRTDGASRRGAARGDARGKGCGAHRGVRRRTRESSKRRARAARGGAWPAGRRRGDRRSRARGSGGPAGHPRAGRVRRLRARARRRPRPRGPGHVGSGPGRTSASAWGFRRCSRPARRRRAAAGLGLLEGSVVRLRGRFGPGDRRSAEGPARRAGTRRSPRRRTAGCSRAKPVTTISCTASSSCRAIARSSRQRRSYGGARFVSAVAHENVFACQFHPEKSQRAGIALLERFVAS